MDPATIGTTSFLLTGPGETAVAGVVVYDVASKTATFAPADNLAPNAVYTATLSTGARDLAGNALAADLVWSFTTGVIPDTTAPSVSATRKGVVESDRVDLGGSRIIIKKTMDASTVSQSTFILKQRTTPVACKV